MKNNVFADIWSSARTLPLWVQAWVFLLLTPVNLASLYFISEPMGKLIVGLIFLGVLPNVPIMLAERGISKLMSVSHLPAWTVLVLLIVLARPEGSEAYDYYLTVLAVINGISLLLDYIDSIKWFRGDRAVAGRENRQD